MNLFIFYLEIFGTIAFAISGAMTGLKKKMDIFGMCFLGVTTAVGGGIIRDILLGHVPPETFKNPIYVIVSILASLVIFIPVARKLLYNRKVFEILLLVTDSVGLGIFTVHGVNIAMESDFSDNSFLVVFVAMITGVGGGILRDVLAGNTPYIFVKHVYACASIAGAILCMFLWQITGPNAAMLTGALAITVIRLCAAKFRWSLPKAKDF